MRRSLIVFALVLTGCSQPPPAFEPQPMHLAGMENVFRLTDRVYSGSAPEGEAGFRSLQELGVKTVVTVDGAAPDVETAHRFGLRYVHLPVGYDGIDESRVRELAQALRDLPGPIYVHCHHGKHRGPAAAISAIRCLNPQCTAERAVQFLHQAGTDPKYVGLFADAEREPPKLTDTPMEFPEVAAVPDFTKRMVEIDEAFDRLKTHPTARDGTLLVEHYRELQREAAERDEDFQSILREAVQSAESLETVLREKHDSAAPIRQSGQLCTKCHARFRDRRISSTP